MLFEEMAANLIGPWSIDIAGQTLQIQALMIVDTATTLAEVIHIEDHSSQTALACGFFTVVRTG
jgi:hypothetical protein